MEEEERFWLLGVDWGAATHWARLTDAGGKELGKRSFAHSGEGLAQMAAWALKLSGASPGAIRVAIEVPRGPVVEALMERGFRLFAINPKQADRFRDRFSPAGAKDDSRDTEVLSDALRTDPKAFRELAAAPPEMIELREWTRMHETLGYERTRLCNQMREQLWRYYPQMLELAGEGLDDPWILQLWGLAPTPAQAKRLRRTQVDPLLKKARIRRIDAKGVFAILKAPPVAVSAASVEAASAHVRLLIQRLTLVGQQIRQTEKRLDQLLEALAGPEQAEEDQAEGQPKAQRDVTILRSLPGVARVVAATLLAEASEPLQRRDYHALRCLCGTAPVTRRSGKSLLVTRRRAANPRLANAAFHWARVAAQCDPATKARYAALRARGHNHARALRGVADRLLATACAMLKAGKPYDADHPRRAPT